MITNSRQEKLVIKRWMSRTNTTIIPPPPSVEALLLLVERYTNQMPGYHPRFCWKWRQPPLCPPKVYLIRTFILTGFSGTAGAAKSLQSCLTHVRPHRRQPTRLPHPWDSPGKNTGVGCHFLLQCMKVKSEKEVAQLCPTLNDPMHCSPPGSSIHGIFQARVLEWGAIVFSISGTSVQIKV